MKIILEDVAANRQRWLELKESTIGSSEIATICEVNEYDTPLELWARKTGKLPPKEQTEAMIMGNELEPVCGRVFSRKARLPVERANVLVGHDSLEWATASPDFWVLMGAARKILEAKFTLPRNRHIWEDGTPKTYMLQLNWQLGVCGIDHGYVAGLIGGDSEDFTWENLVFSKELFDYCAERAERFMELVRSDTPPKAGPGDSKLVALLQGPRIEDIEELQQDALALADYFCEVRDRRSALKKELDALDDEYDGAKAQLMQLLGNKQLGMLPDGRHVTAKTSRNGGYTVEPFEYVTVSVKQPKEKKYGRGK